MSMRTQVERMTPPSPLARSNREICSICFAGIAGQTTNKSTTATARAEAERFAVSVCSSKINPTVVRDTDADAAQIYERHRAMALENNAFLSRLFMAESGGRGRDERTDGRADGTAHAFT